MPHLVVILLMEKARAWEPLAMPPEAQEHCGYDNYADAPGHSMAFTLVVKDSNTTNPKLRSFSTAELDVIDKALAAWTPAQTVVSQLPERADWAFSRASSTVNDLLYHQGVFEPGNYIFKATSHPVGFGDSSAAVAIVPDPNALGCPRATTHLIVRENTSNVTYWNLTPPISRPTGDVIPWLGGLVMHELGHVLALGHRPSIVTLMDPNQHYGGNPGVANPNDILYRVTGDEYAALVDKYGTSSYTPEQNFMLHRFKQLSPFCALGPLLPNPVPNPNHFSWKVWTEDEARCTSGNDWSFIPSFFPPMTGPIGWVMCESDCRCNGGSLCQQEGYSAYSVTECEDLEITPPSPFLISHVSSDDTAVQVKVRMGLIASSTTDCSSPDVTLGDRYVTVAPSDGNYFELSWESGGDGGIPDVVPGAEWPNYYAEFFVCAKIDPDDEFFETSEDDNQIVSEAKMLILSRDHYCS
jgi:hypothetical protein